MSQLAPLKPHKPLTVSLSDDTYSAYADNFDLSLLPNETELPLSPQSEYSSSSSSSSSSSFQLQPASSVATVSPYTLSSSSSSSASSSSSSSTATHVSLDYIPTTIYHDQTVTQIKIEKPWSDDTLHHSSTTLNHTNSNSILLEQLQHHYKFYPSPQPSPDHFHLNNNNNSSGPPATVNASIYPPSPCPSIDAKSPYSSHQLHQIKQELHILPPSPPESSCGAPSPHSFADIKQEPDEAFIDINSLLEKSLSSMRQETTNTTNPNDSKPQIVSHHHHHHHHQHHHSHQQSQQQPTSQDNQLLREYLEDTTFQKKHNLKPVALETLIGGLGVRGDIEPVISLALEHAKREAEATCNKLQISADPQKWTPPQVHAWLRSTADQFKLPPIIDLELKFPEDGTTLSLLTEEEFVRRAPEAGSIIHAQLEIWKLACSDNFTNNFNANPNNNIVGTVNTATNTTAPTTSATPSVVTDIWSSECIQSMDMDVSDDDEEETLPPGTVNSAPAMASTVTSNGPSVTPSPTTKTPTGRTGGSHIHLWQFLKELLATPHVNGTAIRWIDRSKGVFKIEDSVRVAKLWGRRKNRPAMNYDKLSRSIRQYYKKGIMKKTERSQRLVYQFCHPYCL